MSFYKFFRIIYEKLILKINNMLFKMVLTRSQEKNIKENEKQGNTLQKKKTKIDLTNLISNVLKKKLETKSNSHDVEDDDDNIEEEEEEEEDEDFFENDFTLPGSVQSNSKLAEKANKLIEKIQNESPTLEKILNTKMSNKNKMELFELYYIYRYTEPNSDERFALKTEMNTKMKEYVKLHQQKMKYKDKILMLEKKLSNNDELFQLKSSILELDCDEDAREYLYSKYLILEKSEMKDEEYIKIKLILKEALQLPYKKCVDIPKNFSTKSALENIKKVFDDELYGMDNVKEQLMIFFHNKFCNPSSKGCCLGLIGPAGVGKTTIAHCLAKIMNLPFEQIPLGGLSGGESMKGHDSTYIGSRPGQITKALMKLKHKNGIIFFDEFDKIDGNIDLVNSMLHITDFAQNHQFRDNFFGELNIDLSSLWFIASMNEKPQNEILSDRIFFISVDGYNMKDKQKILKNYLIPKIVKQSKRNLEDFIFSDEIISYFITSQDKEQNRGIRLLESKLNDFINKILFLYTTQREIPVSFNLPKSYFPLNFPIKVEKDMIDILLKDQQKSNFNYLTMYV